MRFPIDMQTGTFTQRYHTAEGMGKEIDNIIHNQAALIRQQAQQDLHITAVPFTDIQFQSNTRVMVHMPPIIEQNKGSHKFANFWHGPYTLVQQTGPTTCQIDIDGQPEKPSTPSTSRHFTQGRKEHDATTRNPPSAPHPLDKKNENGKAHRKRIPNRVDKRHKQLESIAPTWETEENVLTWATNLIEERKNRHR